MNHVIQLYSVPGMKPIWVSPIGYSSREEAEQDAIAAHMDWCVRNGKYAYVKIEERQQ